MSTRRLAGALIGAGLLAAATGGQAAAATKTVYAGPNARLTPKDLVVNDFFRRTESPWWIVTVRRKKSLITRSFGVSRALGPA